MHRAAQRRAFHEVSALTLPLHLQAAGSRTERRDATQWDAMERRAGQTAERRGKLRTALANRERESLQSRRRNGTEQVRERCAAQCSARGEVRCASASRAADWRTHEPHERTRRTQSRHSLKGKQRKGKGGIGKRGDPVTSRPSRPVHSENAYQYCAFELNRYSTSTVELL